MCDRSGYPSSDNNIRLFTEAECTQKGGIWHANGECTKSAGGSYSWDCRDVNNDPLDMLWQKRYYIGGAVVVGGLLYWRMRK